MHTYRVQLKLLSGLGTPLAADTLWGHLAWGIRYRSGNHALEQWLARYQSDSPPLVISDPLPSGYFPRPVVPTLPPPPQPPPPEQADRWKGLSKRGWITHAAWQQLAGEVSTHSVHLAAERSPPPPAGAAMAVTRAGVNRLTGGTAQPEGGTLFTAEQTYFDFSHPPCFDVWCLSPESPEVVYRWFEDALLGGYGRDASAGLGNLKVLNVAHTTLPATQNPNACLLLGPAVPRPGDPHRGLFRSGVRAGRLGGDFSIGPLPGGATTRHKRPVRCLLAGTLLVCPQGAPPYIGRLLDGVHPQLPSVRHYGLAPVLPCRLADELLRHRLLDERTLADPYGLTVAQEASDP